MALKRKSIPAEVRRHALAMLSAGIATLPEMARLLGVSTHMLWNWCRLEEIDWRKARLGRLTKAWRQQLGERPLTKRKQTMRKEAVDAKARWDREHGQHS